MFLGISDSALTLKNQVYYPSKFLKETGKDLFITNWFEFSLIILPYSEAERLMSLITNDLVTLLPEGRRIQRFLYGGAEKVTINSEGRFTLPQHLKNYALIQKEIVFRGVGDRIELWSRESFDRYGYLTDEATREAAINLFRETKK